MYYWPLKKLLIYNAFKRKMLNAKCNFYTILFEKEGWGRFCFINLPSAFVKTLAGK